MFYHGGYWEAMGVEYAGTAAIPLTKNGATYVAVGYTLAPKANMTTIVEQCRKSVQFLCKRFPTKRMFLAGHSAGAHLAACLMTTDWGRYGLETPPFSGSVLLGGVFDLTPLQKMYCNDSLHLTPQEIAEFSPQLRAELLGKLPPDFQCLVVHGQHESTEFKRQSREFFQALVDDGVKCSSPEISGSDHFELTERLPEEDFVLTQMIINLMTKPSD
jgi:arylformamidase